MSASPTRSLRSSPHSSPDPLRTLAQEIQRENEREFERSQRSPRVAMQPSPSPPRGFTIPNRQTHVDYQQSTSTREYRSDYQNAELRALSESMRSLGGGAYAASSTPAHAAPSFCAICDSEEQNMSSSQRHSHEQHRAVPNSYTPSQPLSRPMYGGYTPQIPLSTWNPQTSAFTPAASLNATMSAEEAAMFSAQPSRAVLSALRSLQDKLQELRVEKAALENKMSRDQQTAVEREYEQTKKMDRTIAELTAKLAEQEASWMTRAKESRETEEKLNHKNLKLENELRMIKEQAERREGDIKAVREDGHKLKLRINDTELALARSQNDHSSMQREYEVARAEVHDKELEIQRLKNEVNRLAESLHQAHQQQQQLRLQLTASEEQRDIVDRSHTESQNTIQRLASDLKAVQRDLIVERDVKQQLLNYKYLTRDYVTSLLNLNYELSIDAGMSVRKRNDLLQHSHDLLQGLKKQAWSMEFEHPQASEQSDGASSFDPNGSGSNAQGGQFTPRKNGVNIGGVQTSIEEQRYLLAGASSPEAIRVLHPDVRSSEEDHDHSHSASEDDAPVRLRSSIRAPTTPTVSTTMKKQPAKVRGASTKGAMHSHTLTTRGMELPFTVGKSSKQSFSLPVNVQEILAKQPSYYSKVSQKQLAQSRQRANERLPGPVEEERIVVYPPPPADSGHASASSSDARKPEAISLAAHSEGLQTVISHLEKEVEVLNRDYIHYLDHADRETSESKAQLQKTLTSILRSIESKTKSISQLKQHQEAVQGNHGVRLYGAATAASKNSSRAPSAKRTGAVAIVTKRPSSTSSSRSTSVARKGSRAPSTKKRVSIAPVAASSTSTDLTDRHAHHQHGTQTSTPRKSTYDVDSATPALGYMSPNAQQVLEKKIKSMRLLGQFKEMFSPTSAEEDGQAARRFGSD